MTRVLSTKYLEVRYEPRWPAVAIGFSSGKCIQRTFIVIVTPLVVEIGRRS